MAAMKTSRALAHVLVAFLLAITSMAVAIPTADAHAELRSASPAAGETVGGEFHQISLRFIGLDPELPQNIQLFDPAGNLIKEGGAVEGQVVALSIDPLELRGEYIVIYHQFDPAVEPPSPLDLGGPSEEGIDWILFGVLLAASAIAAFMVHRFATAVRDHRAAQRGRDLDEDERTDETASTVANTP